MTNENGYGPEETPPGKPHILPKAVIDAADWNWSCVPTKIVLYVTVPMEPEQAERSILPLIDAIDQFDRIQGGEGFRLLSKQQEDFTALVEMAPNGTTNVPRRIREAVAEIRGKSKCRIYAA
jgi:hypothetical protein